MKRTHIGKLTWKLLVLYALVLVLVAFAEPRPDRPWFWAGLALVVLGEAVRIWAAGHLVKNKELTTTGPYAHVKNPLYVGTFLVMAGFCVLAQGGGKGNRLFDNMNWVLLGAGAAGFLLYYVPYKKRREGGRLREIFGAAWEEYDRRVPDYFPRLRPYRRAGGAPRRWSFRTVCENSEQWAPVAIAAGVLAVLFSREITSFFLRYGW